MSFPQYVTDGSHIYIWNEEFESLFEQGKLRPSPPPEVPKVKKLSPKEKVKMEAMRKKAIADAEAALKLFRAGDLEVSTDDVFGAEPK